MTPLAHKNDLMHYDEPQFCVARAFGQVYSVAIAWTPNVEILKNVHTYLLFYASI